MEWKSIYWGRNDRIYLALRLRLRKEARFQELGTGSESNSGGDGGGGSDKSDPWLCHGLSIVIPTIKPFSISVTIFI